MNPNPNLTPRRGQAIALPQGGVESVLATHKVVRTTCLLQLLGFMGGDD